MVAVLPDNDESWRSKNETPSEYTLLYAQHPAVSFRAAARNLALGFSYAVQAGSDWLRISSELRRSDSTSQGKARFLALLGMTEGVLG